MTTASKPAIARDAAQLALLVLDRNCPRAAPTVTPAAPR